MEVKLQARVQLLLILALLCWCVWLLLESGFFILKSNTSNSPAASSTDSQGRRPGAQRFSQASDDVSARAWRTVIEKATPLSGMRMVLTKGR